MADTPYNPETGEWTVFADPRPDKDGPYEKAVAHVPGTRPFSTPTQVLLWGDVKRAESYYPQAAQLLAEANRENVNDQPFFFKERKLGGDVRFKCRRDLYQDFIEIEAKPNPVPPGPMHLNFDASKQKTFGNYFYDTNIGIPFYLDYSNSVSFDSDGMKIYSAAGGTGESSGAVYYNPKTSDKYSRTIAMAFNVDIPFRYVSGSSPSVVSGNGSFDQYSYTMSPGSYVHNVIYGYSYQPDSSSLPITSINFYIPGTSGDSYAKEHRGEESASHIFIVRTKSFDTSVGSLGEYTFSYEQEAFLDGTKILQETGEGVSWGDYYGNNRTMFYQHAITGDESSFNIKQQMLFDSHLSTDSISSLTDELAAKWGF